MTAGGTGGAGVGTTVAQALAAARTAGVERLDAHLLLARVLDRPRTWLLAHDDAVLGADEAAAFNHDLARRSDGEPLAYIVGTKEFHGLWLMVDPRVLVPRPDTELLVDWAIDRLAAIGPSVRPVQVLDLGTGSGAVALAIKAACPDTDVLATDVSAAALQVATLNAMRLGLAVDFIAGSWWRAVAIDLRFDVVVSNPPYIAAQDDHLPALRHEPLQALTPGGDGLASLREIVADAGPRLRPGGWLLLEHGHDQAEAVRGMLNAQGYREVQTRVDIAGRPRCTGGRANG